MFSSILLLSAAAVCAPTMHTMLIHPLVPTAYDETAFIPDPSPDLTKRSWFGNLLKNLPDKRFSAAPRRPHAPGDAFATSTSLPGE